MGAHSPLLSLLALLSLGLSNAENVVTVNADNFKEVVTGNPNVVVEFYAPWCGHCKKLAPEYEKAAGMLLKKDPKVILAKCDATDDKNKGLATKYGVKGFPTLKMFHGSEEGPTDYLGTREADGIVSYLYKAYGPASTHIKDAESMADFMKNEVVVLGVFKDKDSAEMKVFLEAAAALKEEADFGHTFDAGLVKRCEEVACGKATVMVEIAEEGLFKTYTGPFVKEDVVQWVEKTTTPELVELKSSGRMKRALTKVFANKRIKVVVFCTKEYDRLDEMKKVLIKAREQENEVDILYGATEGNDKALKQFNVNPDDFPAFIAHDPEKNLKYLETKVKPEDFSEFLRKLKAGLLEASMKSEDPPEKNDGPVKIVTAKTYKELVLDSGNNTFIEFYAPWCGHCKKLAPVYEKLGKHFQGSDAVTIAKMDATMNDIPDPRIKITGFPTLKFISGKTDGSISDYKGQRSLDDLIRYVNERVGAPVEEEDDEYVDDDDDVKEEL